MQHQNLTFIFILKSSKKSNINKSLSKYNTIKIGFIAI